MGSHSPSSRKSKKHKKQKHKRHKEHKSRKNRGDSSDSDASPDVNTQLFKSRAVAQATREILAYKYELKSELRELIRQLDAGEALAIDGVEDSYLKSRLDTLFTNLSQVRKTSAGQYYKRSKEGDAIIGFLAPLLAESAGQVAAYAPQGPAVSAVSRVDDPTASRLVEGGASLPNSAVPPPPEAPVARPTDPSAPPGPASEEEEEEDAGRPPHHDSARPAAARCWALPQGAGRRPSPPRRSTPTMPRPGSAAWWSSTPSGWPPRPRRKGRRRRGTEPQPRPRRPRTGTLPPSPGGPLTAKKTSWVGAGTCSLPSSASRPCPPFPPASAAPGGAGVRAAAPAPSSDGMLLGSGCEAEAALLLSECHQVPKGHGMLPDLLE
ncbi:hypothetical protein ACKKBG_A20375 [Auxenochlorella protothecoides x Auxenochlorella symbiontica]